MIYKNPEDDGGFPRDESVVNNLKYSEEQIMRCDVDGTMGSGFSWWKAFFGTLVAAVVVWNLAGCGNKEKDGIGNTREAEVLKIYSSQVGSLTEKPEYIHRDLVNHSRKRTSVDTGFFCDDPDLVKATEYRVREFNRNSKVRVRSPGEIYQEIYGESVSQSCGIADVPKVEEPEFTPTQEVVRGDKLTPEMYDRMIESANYCARSKQFMMNVTKDKGLLTTSDYDGLMDAVLECKRFELEQTLQQ